MKGIFVVEKNRLGFLDIPEPEPGPFDSLVEVLCCGICNSTDRKILGDEFQRGTYPILLGHESVGWLRRKGDSNGSVGPGRRGIRRGPSQTAGHLASIARA